MMEIKQVFKCMALLGVSAMAVDTSAIGRVDDGATATITIDGQPSNVVVEPTESGFQIPAGTQILTEEALITFDQGVQLNPDPSIAYGFSVIDFGAPSVFGFSFATPIVPTGFPGTQVAGSISGGLTDFTDNGVAIAPTIGTDIQVNSTSATGLGGPWINMGVDVGAAFSDPGLATGIARSHTYPAENLGLIPGPAAGPYNALKVDLNFSLSGAGDIASLTGSASIIDAPTVPDGGAGFAGIAAIVGLLAASRRRS
jgi:hypothetical protein